MTAYRTIRNQGNRIRRTKVSDGSYEDYTWDHRNRLTKVTFYSVSIAFMAEGGPGSEAIFGVETAAYDQTLDSRKLGLTFSAHPGSGAIFGFETVAHDQTGEGRNLGLTPSPDGSFNFGPSISKTVDYTYDVFNRLIKRVYDSNGPAPDGQQTHFFAGYDGINPTLAFKGGSVSDLSNRFLWGAIVDQLFADEQITNPLMEGNTIWPLGDHLGTLRDLADFDGTSYSVANHRVYDSFGKLTSETNSAVDTYFGYTGKYFDRITGLSNHWHRWYDPQLGKWISEDPISFAAGDANLARYVKNSPLDRIDWTGLIEDPWYNDHWTDYLNPYAYVASWADWWYGHSPKTFHNDVEARRKIREAVINNPNLDPELWRETLYARESEAGAMKTLIEVDIAVKSSAPGFVTPVGGGLTTVGGLTDDAIRANRARGRTLPGTNLSKPPLRYQLGPNDVDWRGTAKTFEDALDHAFSQTGIARSEFNVTKWGKDKWGKSHPVEWRHSSGAEVNIDWPHAHNGPDAPHVGWQSGGKRGSGGAKRGHVILDEVPYNRSTIR